MPYRGKIRVAGQGRIRGLSPKWTVAFRKKGNSESLRREAGRTGSAGGGLLKAIGEVRTLELPGVKRRAKG